MTHIYYDYDKHIIPHYAWFLRPVWYSYYFYGAKIKKGDYKKTQYKSQLCSKTFKVNFCKQIEYFNIT